MLLLRLPFAEEDPFFVTLKKEQFEQAKSLGYMVGEDVFDVLREIERRQFSKQIDKLPAECAIDRDQAVDRVFIAKVSLFKKLQVATEREVLSERTAEGGIYDRLLRKNKIADAPFTHDLISIGATGSSHFSEVLFLPLTQKAFAVDSCAPRGHYQLSDRVITPFIEHALDRAFGTRHCADTSSDSDNGGVKVELVRKDAVHFTMHGIRFVGRRALNSKMQLATAQTFALSLRPCSRALRSRSSSSCMRSAKLGSNL